MRDEDTSFVIVGTAKLPQPESLVARRTQLQRKQTAWLRVCSGAQSSVHGCCEMQSHHCPVAVGRHTQQLTSILADVHFTWSTQNTAEIPGGNSCGLCHASFFVLLSRIKEESAAFKRSESLSFSFNAIADSLLRVMLGNAGNTPSKRW